MNTPTFSVAWFFIAAMFSCGPSQPASSLGEPQGSQARPLGAQNGTAQAPVLTKARRSDAFVESVGVNTHYYYLDRTLADGSSMEAKILSLGVKHLRDGLDLNFMADEKNVDVFNRLHAAGIRYSFITSFKLYSAQQAHGWLKSFGPQKVMSIENRNEPDLFDRNPDGSWPIQEVRDYQISLWNAVKADLATQDVEVIGSPVTSLEAAEQFGRNVAYFMDRANIHNYLSTREPETLGWGGDGYGSLDFAVRRVANPMKPGNRAPLSTETCYQNTDDINGLPEKFSARYIVRQYLFSFQFGIPRTYCYQLWDEGPNPNAPGESFGFLRYDGSAKPAYVAVRNMLALLKDTGTPFAEGSLELGMSGEIDGVRQVLLQKSDGHFFLAMWIGKQSWEPNQRIEVDVPDQTVTLSLPTTISKAVAHALQPSGEMQRRDIELQGNTVSLAVSDDVLFLELF
jgi:hypothetical protein